MLQVPWNLVYKKKHSPSVCFLTTYLDKWSSWCHEAHMLVEKELDIYNDLSVNLNEVRKHYCTWW